MADQGDFAIIEEKRKANEEIDKLPANEQDAAWDKFFASHRHGVKRLALGRNPDASVGLELRDQNGRVRVNLGVRSNGDPVLKFLSEDGKVLREFVSSSK
jgi:hypothetical protein